MTFTLHIPKISLNLFIGYFPEERDSKKQIEIEIILKYKKLPQSCFTDSLEDKKSTICYKNIIESLNSFIKNKNYLTIEKWCYEISRFLIYEFEFVVYVCIFSQTSKLFILFCQTNHYDNQLNNQ